MKIDVEDVGGEIGEDKEKIEDVDSDDDSRH